MLEATIQKKNGEKITKCVFMVNGILTIDERRPIFSAALLEKYGVSKALANETTVWTITPALNKCIYREGTMEDGTVVTLRDPEAERKDERAKQNSFLKANGYIWKKEPRYISGGEDLSGRYDGDFKDEWVLRGPDGKEITCPIDDLLTELGYFGEQGKADMKERKAKEYRDFLRREEVKKSGRNGSRLFSFK